MRKRVALAWLVIVGCGGETDRDGSSGAGGVGGVGGSGGLVSSGGYPGGYYDGGNVGGGGISCNPGDVECDAPAPICSPGEVPSVEGSCWGPCVPILSCGAGDCIDCKGFCAAYVYDMPGGAVAADYRCLLPAVPCSAYACSCLSQYMCAPPYDVCSENANGGGEPIICSCPSC